MINIFHSQNVPPAAIFEYSDHSTIKNVNIGSAGESLTFDVTSTIGGVSAVWILLSTVPAWIQPAINLTTLSFTVLPGTGEERSFEMEFLQPESGLTLTMTVIQDN
jgi:hypothetical protein